MLIRRVHGLVFSELMFILLIISALAMVIFVGKLSLDEARRTESTKETAVGLLRWFNDLASDSSKVSAALQEKCKPADPVTGSAPKTEGAVEHPVADDVLDVVRHHRQRGGDEVHAVLRMAQRGETLG